MDHFINNNLNNSNISEKKENIIKNQKEKESISLFNDSNHTDANNFFINNSINKKQNTESNQFQNTFKPKGNLIVNNEKKNENIQNKVLLFINF